MKYLTLKNTVLVLLLLFVAIQFFRIDKSNPPLILENDFITINKTPENIAAILHKACYDCHSNDSKYPWYSNIAPISWWLKDHILEAREELNFSEWAEMSTKEKRKKLKESAEEIEKGEMPLTSYTLIHQNAKLTTEEIVLLKNYFAEISIRSIE